MKRIILLTMFIALCCSQSASSLGNVRYEKDEEQTFRPGILVKREGELSSIKGKDSVAEELKLSAPVPVYIPENNISDSARVKNVILLIGDGMGILQAYAAYTVNGGLSMFNMSTTAFVRTHSGNRFTTDSAASGSAMATGQPTSNRKISMRDDGTPNTSITEILSAEGLACGVVSLGHIDDATPAAFYAHSMERRSPYEITACIESGHVTFVCGGGTRFFEDRPDGRNLFEELSEQYRITKSYYDIDTTGIKEICIDDTMEEKANESNLYQLAEITAKTLKKLDKAGGDKGFFTMIEGAKIDYAGHGNFLPATVMETLSFDLAVAEALKFADADGETLVIVTADHETGGMALVDGNSDENSITVKYTSSNHTPAPVPLFAYGPGSENFTGVIRNTDIFQKIIKLIGR